MWFPVHVLPVSPHPDHGAFPLFCSLRVAFLANLWSADYSPGTD